MNTLIEVFTSLKTLGDFENNIKTTHRVLVHNISGKKKRL